MLKGWRSLCNRSDLQGAFRHDQRVHFPFGLTNHSSAAHGSLWLLHHADWGCHCDSTSWSFWMAGPTHFLWIGTGVMYILREFYYLACHVQHATAPPLNTLQPGSGGEALAHFWYFESGPSVASAGCWHERQAAWLQMLGTLDQICQNTTNTTNKHSGKISVAGAKPVMCCTWSRQILFGKPLMPAFGLMCIDVFLCLSPGRASSLGWALKARWCCVLAARLPSCGWAFWLKICLVWSLCAFCSYAQNSAVKFVWILLRLLAPLIPALCRRYRAIQPASLFGCPILWGWSPFLSIKD